MITPTHHEKMEWARLAQAAYGSDRNDIGHRFSGAATLRNGESMPVARFDALQSEYQEWLTVGFSDVKAPTFFSYSRWRHGGWYVENVRYPSGAVGCVSRNYEDRKWRIACDPRPFEEQPTFKTRDEAALAEWTLIQQGEAT